MHVAGLHKLFKAKKVYIRGKNMQKGYGKVSVGREDKWYKGGGRGIRWECDGVQGGGEEGQEGRWGGGMGCAGMQNEEISKETVGEWGGGGITYHIHGHRGSHEGGIGQRGSRV
jgi:hypothetical protein